jgi:hypothetical protein
MGDKTVSKRECRSCGSRSDETDFSEKHMCTDCATEVLPSDVWRKPHRINTRRSALAAKRHRDKSDQLDLVDYIERMT